MLGIILVGNSKQLVSVIAVLAGSVDFQFYSQIPVRIVPVKYRLRLKSVVVYRTISVNFVMIAVTAIIVAVKMISVILMQ